MPSVPSASADSSTVPTDVTTQSGIQSAQDYLDRLLKVDPNNNGAGGAIVGEYPGIPLYIEYYSGSSFISSSFADAASITTNFYGTTSESFDYNFTGPAGFCQSSYQPVVNMTYVFYGAGGIGNTFSTNIFWSVNNYVNCLTVNVYLANIELASVAPYTESSSSGWETISTTPTKNIQGSINGFEFNQPGAQYQVGSEPYFTSERYTVRSGTQAGYHWAQDAMISGAGVPNSQLQADLFQMGSANGFPAQDVYSPSYLKMQNAGWSFEDPPTNSLGQVGSGTIYQDCAAGVNLPQGFDSAYGAYYPYNSKVCDNPGYYLGIVWGHDPLVMTNVALAVLMQYGPNDAAIPWNGQMVTPVIFLADLISEGWIQSGPFSGDLQVDYPNTDPITGDITGPNSNLGSGDRTGIVGELATLLAYKYGQPSFQSTAQGLIQMVMDAQWGVRMGVASNVGVGEDYVNYQIDNFAGLLFRPQNTGGEMIAWDTSSGYEDTPTNYVSDMFNMPPEYVGVIPTNQEATQEALTALWTYWNYAGGWGGTCKTCAVTRGIQPFNNYMFDNVGTTPQSAIIDLNGIYPSGTYNLLVNLDDEGDTAPRDFNVWVNGNQIYSYTTPAGGYADNGYNLYTIPLGSLVSTTAYQLQIELSTYDYLSPHDYWLVSAAVIPAPPTTAPLTIQTEFSNGTQITGLYTVIENSGGTILQTGYSPLTYTATVGDTYQVQVDNYGNYVFTDWAGGSTSNPTTVTVTGTTTLTAYYTYA